MAEAKEADRQRLINDITDRVVKATADQFAALTAKITALENQVIAFASTTKKPVKTKAGTATTANGTAEQKATANGEQPKAAGGQNALIYFKNQYSEDKKIRDELWKDEYKDAMAKIEKYNKTMAKKKDGEMHKQRADYIWNVLNKDDKGFKKKWQEAAKTGGKVASSGGDQLKADS